MTASSKVVRYEIEATIIRADGTEEPLGVITATDWKLKPHKRVASWYRIKKANRNVERR